MTGNRRWCLRISASPFPPPPPSSPAPMASWREPGAGSASRHSMALSNGDKTTWTVVVKWIWYLNQQKSICDCSGEIHPGQGDDVEVQEVQRHLPGYFSPPTSSYPGSAPGSSGPWGAGNRPAPTGWTGEGDSAKPHRFWTERWRGHRANRKTPEGQTAG